MGQIRHTGAEGDVVHVVQAALVIGTTEDVQLALVLQRYSGWESQNRTKHKRILLLAESDRSLKRGKKKQRTP